VGGRNRRRVGSGQALAHPRQHPLPCDRLEREVARIRVDDGPGEVLADLHRPVGSGEAVHRRVAASDERRPAGAVGPEVGDLFLRDRDLWQREQVADDSARPRTGRHDTDLGAHLSARRAHDDAVAARLDGDHLLAEVDRRSASDRRAMHCSDGAVGVHGRGVGLMHDQAVEAEPREAALRLGRIELLRRDAGRAARGDDVGELLCVAEVDPTGHRQQVRAGLALERTPQRDGRQRHLHVHRIRVRSAHDPLAAVRRAARVAGFEPVDRDDGAPAAGEPPRRCRACAAATHDRDVDPLRLHPSSTVPDRLRDRLRAEPAQERDRKVRRP